LRGGVEGSVKQSLARGRLSKEEVVRDIMVDVDSAIEGKGNRTSEGAVGEQGMGVGDGSRTTRFFSRMGRPQPHFVHFWPMCCSQMPRQRISSSASDRQRRDTWAARQREVASR